MKAEEVARALGKARRSGNGWECLCPVHENERSEPSLSLHDHGPRLLWHCHAGCSQDKVREALRARALLNGNGGGGHRSPFHHAQFGAPAAAWFYRLADGKVAFVVARYTLADGGKTVRPWRSTEDGFECKAMEAPRPLYRLPELLADKAKPVLVVEGEKCAEAAAGLLTGYAVTTWPGGAKGTDKTDWLPLKGRSVTIWPDADKQGRVAASAIVALVGPIVAKVAVLDPGERAKGWDVADAIAEGWSASDLQTLIEEHSAPCAESLPRLTGAELLDAVHEFLGRFIAYPLPEAQVAHALWIAHAHLLDAFESTPRIAFLSPERSSGKTRALEVTETLVPLPIHAVNVTSAYLFRKIGDPDGRPTILFDEVDTVFGPKAREHEDLRGVLNSGHRKGATAGRCVVRGKLIETEELPSYCAVAMAGIGDLPDTICSRSVLIPMKRRAPGELVEPYRTRVHEPQGHELRDQLAAWAKGIAGALGIPDMPAGVTDRDADVWEALLMVADAAGGEWPTRARVSAVSLVSLAREETQTLGVRLLADLRSVFGDAEALFTRDVLHKLIELDESPWGDIRGKPLDERGLARILKQYKVKPRQVRVDAGTAKGYARADLHDPWARYLSLTS